MKRAPLPVALLLFASGACSLVYQTVWARELKLIFGASTGATAAVLGLFMGGLGLGGWLLGSRVERSERPLALYGRLELLIAASAALSPAVLAGVRHLYLALGGLDQLGPVGTTVARLALAVLVLGVPTVAMGGTLPAAARAVTGAGDTSRTQVALLFGLNTLGAVSGVLLSTFVLLERWGNRQTLWLACGVNLALAGVALAWSRRPAAPAPEAAARPAPAPSRAPLPMAAVYAVAAAVGFAFMLMELTWYRMLAPLLGGSTYSFGLILATALLGIGVGGALFAWWGASREVSAGHLAFTCALEALLLVLPLVAGDDVALLAAFLRPAGVLGFGALVAGWSVITALVVLPGALVSGFQFPLLIALLGRAEAGVGRQVGLAYAWNTLGSIVGSLAGGFGLLPLLGAVNAWRLTGALLAIAGLATAILGPRRARGLGVAAAPVLLGAALLWLSPGGGPTAVWRHSAIGAGRLDVRRPTTANELEAMLRRIRTNIFAQRDGLESGIALAGGTGLAFYVNGKSDGHLFNDRGTQVMGGLIGAALHPEVKRALVVGLGTGSTAGWLARVPSVERVDVAELEPAIVDVARVMRPANQDPLGNPRVKVFLGDAREYLLTSKAPYDLIFSEPSNPYRAGVSSLYTREYYEAASTRLGPQGLFLQWVQTYEVQPRTVRTVLATLASVFANVEVWSTQSGDVVLVASNSPVPHRVDALRARLAQEPFASALRLAWRVEDVEGFLAHHVAGPAVARQALEQQPRELNTDDHNLIEFAFARSVGQAVGLSEDMLARAAMALNALHPQVTEGAVDWQVVEEQAAFSVLPPALLKSRLPAAAQARLEAFGETPEVAVQRWAAAPFEPSGPAARMTLAWALADQGRAEAEPLIEKLGGFPVEQRILRGLLRLRQQQPDAALSEATAAFAALRASPWCEPAIGVILFSTLVPTLAQRDAAAANALWAELRAPLPNLAFDEPRTMARLELSQGLDFRATCQDSLAPFEPHTLWTQKHLRLRVECYRATRSPLLALAEADLARFEAREPQPLLGPRP